MSAAICVDPDSIPYPNAVNTADSDPVAPAIHLSLSPSHSKDPVAGPSLTAIPPKAAPLPFNAIILSSIFNVSELTVVVVPDTVKLPVTVVFAN